MPLSINLHTFEWFNKIACRSERTAYTANNRGGADSRPASRMLSHVSDMYDMEFQIRVYVMFQSECKRSSSSSFISYLYGSLYSIPCSGRYCLVSCSLIFCSSRPRWERDKSQVSQDPARITLQWHLSLFCKEKKPKHILSDVSDHTVNGNGHSSFCLNFYFGMLYLYKSMHVCVPLFHM